MQYFKGELKLKPEVALDVFNFHYGFYPVYPINQRLIVYIHELGGFDAVAVAGQIYIKGFGEISSGLFVMSD